MRTGGACLLLRRESGSVAPRRVRMFSFCLISLLFATDPSEFARNSFVCNRSGKPGGEGGYPPAKVSKAGEVKRARGSAAGTGEACACGPERKRSRMEPGEDGTTESHNIVAQILRRFNTITS
jgi:hypothetical protein